jgi:hypothetical protein
MDAARCDFTWSLADAYDIGQRQIIAEDPTQDELYYKHCWVAPCSIHISVSIFP